MSPNRFASSGYASVFYVSSDGYFGNNNVNGTLGVRPVINLRANVTISSGDGTSSNPYVIS